MLCSLMALVTFKWHYITKFCIQFRITLQSMSSRWQWQRKSLTVQLNSRPVRRIELYMKVCTGRIFTMKLLLVEVTGNTFSSHHFPPQFNGRENCIQNIFLNFLRRHPCCLKHPQYVQKQTRNIISRQDIITESQLRPDRQTEVFGITHR